jgi:hypothetical protein
MLIVNNSIKYIQLNSFKPQLNDVRMPNRIPKKKMTSEEDEDSNIKN